MRALIISAIVLVAVIMGLSTVIPSLAHDVAKGDELGGLPSCQGNFEGMEWPNGEHPDHNGNGAVCMKIVGQGKLIVIDDIAKKQ